MKSRPIQKTMTPPYSRYDFFSKESPIALCKFEIDVEKTVAGTLNRDPSIEKTLNPLMLEVLKTTDELYRLAIESPRAYMAIENKLMSDPAKFREEIAKNKENLDPIQDLYIKLFNFYDLNTSREKYGKTANAISASSIRGSVIITEAVKKKLKPSVHWKEDLEERHSPPAQEPEGSGGSWVSRIQGAKGGRGLG